MTTMELEAYRAELARQILTTESRELLDAVCRTIGRITKRETSSPIQKEDLTPYTMDEINGWIDEAEAEEDAGIPGTSHKEVMENMRKLIASL